MSHFVPYQHSAEKSCGTSSSTANSGAVQGVARGTNMSSRRMAAITGSLLTASFSAVLLLPCSAVADDQGPPSGKGGKTVDEAPAGVKLSTTLPSRISVDNSSQKTAITATVKNDGSKDSGDIR